MSNIFYIGAIVLLKTAIYCQDIGEECLLRSSGSPGTCKPLKDCRQAYEELSSSGKYPQTCGFVGNQPLVCCSSSRKPGTISRKKCEEYASYVTNTEVDLTQGCFRTEVPPILIVGGTPVRRREFPHMAAIGFEPTPGNPEWLCGGTILSENYILTAAHCLNHKNQGEPKWVRLGVTSLNSTRERQDIKVAEGIPHPEYKPSSNYHDIALLKLQSPIKLDQYARPACLHLNNEISIENALATGWGLTTWDGSPSNRLLVVNLKVFDFKFCNESYKHHISKRLKKGIIDDIQLCAGSLVEEKDTCQGDSGGPLQIVNKGFGDDKCMYDIIGVTSFGKGCTGSPGVYVRVSHYVKWIEDIVWPKV